MGLDQHARDVESQPQAGIPRRARTPVEPLEQARQRVGGDPRTLVSDTEAGLITDRLNPNPDDQE